MRAQERLRDKQTKEPRLPETIRRRSKRSTRPQSQCGASQSETEEASEKSSFSNPTAETASDAAAPGRLGPQLWTTSTTNNRP